MATKPLTPATRATYLARKGLVAAILAVVLSASAAAATPPRLKYVVIISRHGVRAPTWDTARLNQYSAEPWPNWGVSPGYLTPHGRAGMKLMGAYYRDWLSSEHLLSLSGCQDAERVYIWADKDERTLETGRAFAESIMPGCGLGIHSGSQGGNDPLFSGAGISDPQKSLEALRDRLGPHSQDFVADVRPSLNALQYILSGGRSVPKRLENLPPEISASLHGEEAELNGPFGTASSLSEDLLLEYADGMRGTELGWGRLTKKNLYSILKLHAVYADLTRRTPYLARSRGSNLLEHVLLSIEQAETGKMIPGALGPPGNHVLILAGHDTNLSNLSGMLGISWQLEGYHRNDTPPGGALVFSLWQEPGSGKSFVKTQYVAQSLDEIRDSVPLTKSTPPEKQVVSIPGCETGKMTSGCRWPVFKTILQHAIDPAFVSIEAVDGKTR